MGKYAIGLTLGAGAIVGRRFIPKDWRSRGRMAIHVLRGRPAVYKVKLVPPPALNLAGDQEHVHVEGCHINNGYGMQVQA